jgi:hypothetical protein
LSVKNTLQQGGNWYNEIGRNYNEISRLTEYQLKKIKLEFKKKEIFFQKNHAYEKKYVNKKHYSSIRVRGGLGGVKGGFSL